MKLLIAAFLTVLFVAGAASSQETSFGKNKVQYRDFDWKYIQSRHFDIYFYDHSYPTAKFTADVMESAYVEIAGELEYKIQKRVPVFIYNSHNDFQQTNITSSLLPEGVGGFTEAFKNRIVIPFTGSYEDMRHVLHHELTHAVVYDMLFGNSLSTLLSRQRFFDLPLWYAEGYAEYSSRRGWDYFADMVVRDATINNYLAPPMYLGGYLAYKQGQAMVKFIADKYGEDKLGEILQKGKIHLTMNKALKSTLGISEEDLFKEFSKEMKRRYWPEIAVRKEADEIGKQLTKARKDGSYFNEKPVFSPEGDRIAIFTDKSDYTEIVLISAVDGKVIDKLTSSERSADLESLHSYVSGMSFSPDGRDIVFVAKAKGQDGLYFLNVKKGKIYKKKRFDFHNILSPSWSPDGTMVAFSALKEYKRDLFIYHIESDEIEQVTDDRFDDLDPSWMPENNELVFSSDRPHPQTQVMDGIGQPYVQHAGSFMPGEFQYGNFNIFKVERAGLGVSPIDVGPGTNKNPSVSPNGKRIAFISNRNGIDNIYIGSVDSNRNYAVTDILTGVQDVSWAPDGEQLAFSAFFNGAFDIFILKQLLPAGQNGVLASTDFALGKYNLLGDSLKAVAALEKAKRDSVRIATQYGDSVFSGDTIAIAQDSLSDTTEIAQSTPDTTNSTGTTDTTQSVVATVPDSASDTTGIYDEDYVYVSKTSGDRLDSLMRKMPSEDSDSSSGPLTEPAAFDSIPSRLSTGEYEIHEYKVRFTPDFVGGGLGYDTFFGLRGQSYFVFSDYLGNHQIYLATDLVNTIDQSYIQAFYFNNKKRVNFGGGFFHSKNFYVDNQDFLFSDRFYGVSFFASRPSSIFSRYEFTFSQFFIDRKFYDRNLGDNRQNGSSEISTGRLSYVFDNVLWGFTGPVNGKRARISLETGINLFDNNDLQFYAGQLDYRKYWHIKKTASMAFRISGGASEGDTPKQYYLGGTTNWIGSRNFDSDVYEVRNLYFSEIVTPLRGVPYYELSGDRFGLVNWELRFPFVQYFALRFPLPLVLSNIAGVLFTDMGAAWFGNNFKGGTRQNGSSRLVDIKTGFGTGVRVNLFGFALLRYDLAWSTDFADVSKKPRHYFSFGADF
ncbi:MAG: hypothetical protein SGI97_10285 [candidate division Zixibacteria bacterium]|nr:hypothetical protein [candidate division Zixibacteria bacterium]